MTNRKSDSELQNLKSQRLDELMRWNEISDKLRSMSRDGSENWNSTVDALMVANRRIQEFDNQINLYTTGPSDRYERPKFIGTQLVNKLLPPLPPGMRKIKVDARTEEIRSSLPNYRIAAALLVMAVMTAIGLLHAFVPFMWVSPLRVFMAAISGSGSSEATGVSALAVVASVVFILMLVFTIVKPDLLKKLIFQAALEEEQWFRSGAQGWTARQKIVSSALFGLVHVTNLVYPIAALVAVGVAGFAFLAAYKQEYRRSSDTERATIAAAKFHAVYNTYAVRIILVIVPVLMVLIFLL